MKAGNVRVQMFSNTSAATLQADINKFFNGEAVTGPPAVVLDFIKEKEFIDIKYSYNGTTHTAMVVYTE